eukprot:301227-Amphidinium_carterae.1
MPRACLSAASQGWLQRGLHMYWRLRGWARMYARVLWTKRVEAGIQGESVCSNLQHQTRVGGLGCVVCFSSPSLRGHFGKRVTNRPSLV